MSVSEPQAASLYKDKHRTFSVMALCCASTSRAELQAGSTLSTLKNTTEFGTAVLPAPSLSRPLRRSVVPNESVILTAKRSPCASSLQVMFTCKLVILVSLRKCYNGH